MQKFMTDIDVIDRVLSHVKHKTTDRGTSVWREPVENYQSADRLASERVMFKSFPTPVCPSAALEKPGDYIAYAAAGTPLIIVRGRDGVVRGFKNACRHRGTQLAEGSGCAGAFVCPYHGWSYGLDGALLGIPHEDGFPDIDKLEHGLVPVQVFEMHGLVYVLQDGDMTEGKKAVKDLPHFFNPDQHLFGKSEGIVEANWKLFLESFIEGYHIKPAHSKTFYPFGYDNLNVIEFCGAHSRVTYPFRRIEKLADTPTENRNVTGNLTYLYQLFPNVIIAKLTHHMNLGILEPIDEKRTKFTNYHMTNRVVDGALDQALEDAQRDLEFVNSSGQQEDIAVVEAAQRSLASGANSHFTFGHFEPAIVHFHEQMTRQLG